MLKKIFTAAFFCLPALILLAAPALAGGPKVVSVNFPPYDFAREIAGDKAELRMLLPPGTESHAFEPTPKDIIAIHACDIFIYTGGETDRWVERLLAAMTPEEKSGKRILRMLDIVPPVEEELVEGMEAEEADGANEEDEEEGPEYDEHVWTAPKNAALIAQAVSEALCGADPANAAFYRSKAAVYARKLADLDADLRALTAAAARRVLIVADRFPFRYLADAYGLRYYAAFPGCAAESEAGAATVAFLINKVREGRIPVVFFLELSNGKLAELISAETGAGARLLHACHNLSKEDFKQGEGYISLMRRNLERLREALY